jgi:hypothetical protein
MRPLLRTVSLTLIVFLCGPSSASAKIVLITHGDTIKHLGDILDPTEKQQLQQAYGFVPAVGFKYSYFGIFWLDLWTWGGEHCYYRDKNYEPIPKDRAAKMLGKSPGDLKPPFLYTFPPGLLVLGGIVLISIPIVIANKAKENRVKALFADERYRAALEQLGQPQARHAEAMARWEEDARLAREANQPEPPQPVPPASDAGYEEAVMSLVREGIPREEAESKLNAMLAALAQQQAKLNPAEAAQHS